MRNAGESPQPLRQVASVYRYRVGEIVITAANEGFNSVPMKDGFVLNVPATKVHDELGEAGLQREVLNITFTPIVLQTRSETVLIDTGYGDSGPSTTGLLLSNLFAAGLKPEDITKVVISHFHADHISGLRFKNGDLVYPKAEILVPEVEWDFWTDENQKARAPETMKANFDNVARVLGPVRNSITRYRWDNEVVKGVTAIDARGHTPGHTAFAIASGNDKLIFVSDVTNHPALFVRNPLWSPAFDIDPEEAVKTRRRILDMIASENLLMAGYHFPFPATGRIAREGERYRFLPAQWMAFV